MSTTKIATIQIHSYDVPSGICRVCLCQDFDACSNDIMGSCSWVEATLCSHCKVMLDQISEIQCLLQERKKRLKKAGNL